MRPKDPQGRAAIYRYRAQALRKEAKTLQREIRQTVLDAADKWDALASHEEFHWSGGKIEE